MIHFTCACGKLLQAPDEFAGRQTRCPTCQREVTLPRAQTGIMPIQAAPAPSAALDQAFARPSIAGQPLPGAFPAPAETSKLAIFSLVLGVLSFCMPLVLGIPAIILGFMGLSAVKKGGGRVGGKGLAITGLVLGFLTLPLVLVYAGGIYGYYTAISTADRIHSMNNMRQIALAMHVHHDATGEFPKQNPNLSWRVMILPYLEEEQLYKQFNFDEPWDGPTNKKLLARMPKVYLDRRFQKPEDQAKGLTYYRAFVGPGSILGDGASLGAISSADMTSNTLLFVEAGDSVPWTKPDDPGFNENGPFGGPNRTSFVGAYADGHVAIIPQKTPSSLIKALITWKGNETVTPP